jgi:hypothetical protein
MPRAVQEGSPTPAAMLADNSKLTPITGSRAWMTVTPDLLTPETSAHFARAML